jgi:hypothetical protein
MATATFDDTFLPMVMRLNRSSVTKRYEAHRDVDWEAAGARIDPRDPRFALPATSALGGTEWYQALPQDVRAELGLDWTCQTLRIGISFESCLSRGLLEFAGALPNGSPTYRYAMHEVIEESHHSMMFHEFIRLSGRSPRDVSRIETWFQRRVAHLGVTFPELFFLCVLSGEIFIDHDNRERLGQSEPLHPTLRRIMQIHVTEEARHVCFANGYLREHLPHSPSWRRVLLRKMAPVLFARAEHMMLWPHPALAKRYGIPSSVIAEAFGPSSAQARTVRRIVEPIYALLQGK